MQFHILYPGNSEPVLLVIDESVKLIVLGVIGFGSEKFPVLDLHYQEHTSFIVCLIQLMRSVNAEPLIYLEEKQDRLEIFVKFEFLLQTQEDLKICGLLLGEGNHHVLLQGLTELRILFSAETDISLGEHYQRFLNEFDRRGEIIILIKENETASPAEIFFQTGYMNKLPYDLE